MIYTNHYDSPVGRILLAARDEALIGLWIDGQKDYLGSLHEEITENENDETFNRTKIWLDRYFRGEKPSVGDLYLAPVGSNFAKSVWKILCEIPYGETTTYGEIAARLAKERGLQKMSAQAVGGAVGHNPISIIIPCHRVVGKGGNLTGYAGGIDKKIKLLSHEGRLKDEFFTPKKARHYKNFLI